MVVPARGGEARCGSRDSGFRGGPRSSGAQGFQEGEACVGALSGDVETRGEPRSVASYVFIVYTQIRKGLASI